MMGWVAGTLPVVCGGGTNSAAHTFSIVREIGVVNILGVLLT